MKRYLMNSLKLTSSGAEGVIRSSISFFFYYLSFLLPMMVLMFFADGLLSGRLRGWAVYTGLILLVSVVMYLIVDRNYRITYNETYKESANLRIEIAGYLSRLPLAYFAKHDLADLAQTIMQDVAQVEHALAHAIGNYLGFVGFFLLMSVMLIGGNWKLGLAIIIPVVMAIAIVFLTKKRQIAIRTKHYRILRDISDDFQNSIDLNQEIKAYGLKEQTKARIEEALIQSEKLQWKAEIAQVVPVSAAQNIAYLPVGTTVLAGVWLLSAGQISLLYFIGYLIAAAKMADSISGLALYLAEIFYLDARIKRIGEIKEHPVQPGQKLPLDHFDLELKDVHFAYNPDQGVINGASFQAAQGEVTALVGPSGSGKTTLLRLISRLYDYDSGIIKIGGQDIKELAAEELFPYISVVFQEVTLFDTSVMENIRIGRVSASDGEVRQAAVQAGCDEFITALPEGYETVIGENGSRLSGGERQRISIARAILKDAPIIILDEIAASLDVENELKIQKSLNRLIKDKTVIVISHRLKSIENADKIVVMEKGRVAAEGKHDELLEISPLYRSMIEKSLLTEAHKY